MYTRAKNVISGNSSKGPEACIEGADVYNSTLLMQLQDPRIERERYIVNKYEYRPDQIANDFYGSTEYEAYVILAAGSVSNLYLGSRHDFIKKSEIDNILKNL